MHTNVIFPNDYIAGDFFVVGDDYENSDFKSLTSKQVKKVIKDINKRSMYYKSNSQGQDTQIEAKRLIYILLGKFFLRPFGRWLCETNYYKN